MARIVVAILALCLLAAAAPAPPAPRTVVLIGGSVPHNPNVHDKRGTIAALARMIATSPELGTLRVKAYPDGWPDDPGAFDGAATVLWYFDGDVNHPLRDPARRAQAAQLIARGVGLVALHQAGTVPAGETHAIALGRWLGAVRPGMVDRTTQVTTLSPARHPVTRGVRPVTYRDEFYPTLHFARGAVPLVRAMLSDETHPAKPTALRVVAWAYPRPDGGRSFGFTGTHFLTSLDEQPVRRLLLNAIAWTAGLKVPAEGVGR